MISGSNFLQPTSYLFEPLQLPTLSFKESLISDQVLPHFIPTSLPSILIFSGEYQQSYIQSTPITDTLQITFAFPKTFDKITITHNNNSETLLSNYTQQNNTATYNLSPILRTMIQGKNEYKLVGYS
jgi:hypothetical protein